MNPLYRDHREAQDKADASNIIAKVTQLKLALAFSLHLERAPRDEVLHYLGMSGEMIPWSQVVWVAYPWCSHNVANDGGSHLVVLCPPDPSPEGVADSLV
jgi:hypothetical protein